MYPELESRAGGAESLAAGPGLTQGGSFSSQRTQRGGEEEVTARQRQWISGKLGDLLVVFVVLRKLWYFRCWE